MTLYRLPYDSHRCEPLQPDSHCRQCLRWAGLPGQTAGSRTPFITRSSSMDESYCYVEDKIKQGVNRDK